MNSVRLTCLLTVLAVLNPSGPAQAMQAAPLVLEWKGFASQTSWTSGSGPSENFLHLRIRGNASVYAGTWVELTGRVWFHDAFFVDPSPPTSPSGIRGLHNWRFMMFKGAPQPWDVAAAGYTVPQGVSVPLCVLEPRKYADMLAKNEADTPNSQIVLQHSEPMLAVPRGQTETIRNWTMPYMHWGSQASDYWAEISAQASVAVISRDALIKRLILDKAPHLTTAFFTGDEWDQLLQRPSGDGVKFQLQGVTMVGGGNDPATYAQTDNNPAGFIGGWTAKATTTDLPFVFFSYTGQSLPFDAGTPSNYGNILAVAGELVVMQMSGLRKNTFALFRINGDNNHIERVQLAAGATVQDAVFRMPPHLVPGDLVELRGFESPGGTSALPGLHSLTYTIIP
jgi:hypothetical protein